MNIFINSKVGEYNYGENANGIEIYCGITYQ